MPSMYSIIVVLIVVASLVASTIPSFLEWRYWKRQAKIAKKRWQEAKKETEKTIKEVRKDWKL